MACFDNIYKMSERWEEDFKHQLDIFNERGPFTKDRVLELCVLMQDSFAFTGDFTVDELLGEVFADCIEKFSVEELIKLRDMTREEKTKFRIGMRGSTLVSFVEHNCFSMSNEQISVFQDMLDWTAAAAHVIQDATDYDSLPNEGEEGNDPNQKNKMWKEVLFLIKSYY